MNGGMPQMPKSQKMINQMVWVALYNHIPSTLRGHKIMMSFILALNGIIVALLAISLLQP